MKNPTALATITNGEHILSVYAVALLLGVHPDDIPDNVDAENLPQKWHQQAYQRTEEARAHGAALNVLSIASYFAKKEHNAHIWTDNAGITWMQTPSPPATPTSENTGLR
ncbi:hypothetical protein SBE55_20000 [Mycolicibacterium sp. 141076]|uniref:hypothetical protein n=1 Tax=Mycobacteriaceae TaxID=1762 RepID=UPI00299D9FF8|nr:hypothetical protein [Mycolicibacterium sp. 141076]MDX1880089.1 hypothetical protein [Mycolicibacterium sp. 141076]